MSAPSVYPSFRDDVPVWRAADGDGVAGVCCVCPIGKHTGHKWALCRAHAKERRRIMRSMQAYRESWSEAAQRDRDGGRQP